MGGNEMDACAGSGRDDTMVTSQQMAEAAAKDTMMTINAEAPAPSAKPKAYTTKLFGKLTEAEKWELQQDLINGMMKDVWQDSDKEFDAIELYKKKTNEFLDKHLQMRKVYSYPVAPKYQVGRYSGLIFQGFATLVFSKYLE